MFRVWHVLCWLLCLDVFSQLAELFGEAQETSEHGVKLTDVESWDENMTYSEDCLHPELCHVWGLLCYEKAAEAPTGPDEAGPSWDAVPAMVDWISLNHEPKLNVSFLVCVIVLSQPGEIS